MAQEKAGGYISKLIFNDMQEVALNKNDIVIFVGPNNVGKSRSLQDIYQLCDSDNPGIVVNAINITKYNSSIVELIESISETTNMHGAIQFNYLGQHNSVMQHSIDNFAIDKNKFKNFKNILIANLNTAARLSICFPPNSINRNAPKTHPIHYAAFDSAHRKWLSDNFEKVFGEKLIPNSYFGQTIPLCIGDKINIDGEYGDTQDLIEDYAEILEKYKQVQEQGDGIKSFTGILLYLMMSNYCIYLFDEPESFLHPPQAKMMGQIIGETLSENQQAFIATHSEDIIKGLLDKCPERIKIIRITREANTNRFAVLDNKAFNTIWSDPLLKHSNIMSSLFHKTVILCESDSDCKLYSIIENHLKQTNGVYSETLFIHCGGKARMSKIASALLALKINVKLIPDIDVLNDEALFKGITDTFGIEWDSIQRDYHIITSNVNSLNDKIDRVNAKRIINGIIDAENNTTLSNKEIKEIKETITASSGWKMIKNAGVAALPKGDASKSFSTLNSQLKKEGIFLVPVGELEGFVKEIGGHGPGWVDNVIEQYPDLNDPVYDKIKAFISEACP